MTIYNSYEEAKIANPESEIYQLVSSGLFTFYTYHKAEVVRFAEFNSNGIKCEPSKYCMTVEKFLADGYKFVGGDIYMLADGMISKVTNAESESKKSMGDSSRFVLRAAALEKKESEDDVLSDYQGISGNYQMNCLLNDAYSGVIGMIEHIENGDCYDKYLNTLKIYEKLIGFAIDNTDYVVNPKSEEKPKHFRVEYEKVEFASDYEHLKRMIDGEKFYTWDGEIEYSFNGARFIGKEKPNHNLSAEWTNPKPTELYRRIETEIDERQEFVEEARKYGSWEAMYDSGKFKLVTAD